MRHRANPAFQSVSVVAALALLLLSSCSDDGQDVVADEPSESTEGATTSTTGSTTTTSVRRPEAVIFDGLTVQLTVPPTVRSGETLDVTLHAENRTESPVTDPGCQLVGTGSALIPVGEPDAELWLVSVVDCGGPYVYEPGMVEESTGPTFIAATKFGDALPPGDYLAAWEVDGQRLEYPVEVVP